jgi:hypothetical protein
MKYFLSFTLFLSFILNINCMIAQESKIDVEDQLKSQDKLDKQAMAEEVKSAFQRAWSGYKLYAWGMDALKPLSNSGHNWYEKSLLMTPVDAYDVMLIMGMDEEAVEARNLIFSELNFDLDIEVQNFEVSIRILGGLISAYELSADKKFLDLAKDLADRLIKAFDSPTGMPYRYVNLMTGKTSGAVSNPAEIGTYLVEYGALSRDLGDPKYYEIAKKAMTTLYSKRSTLNLTGAAINIETGEWTSTSTHISGGIDSYLEYMLKGAILFNDKELMEMWKTSLDAINKHLLDQQPSGTWYGRADMNTGKINVTHYGALDAFFAGSLALAGETKLAKALQESNFKMWMLHGVEPESIDYVKMEVTYPSYELRPENIEGAYYLYQLTHDERYLKMGQQMFRSLQQYCMTDSGFCALKNVVTKEKNDEMESFFLAETLKYAFLLFDDNQSLDFNKVIFNTEAHPYKR